MNGSYQESIRVQIIVNRDPVTFIFKGMPVIAVFSCAAARDLKFTFKIIDPARNNGRCACRQIII